MVSCLVHSSALRVGETSSSETLVDFNTTTCRYIPQHIIKCRHVVGQRPPNVQFRKLQPLLSNDSVNNAFS
jgi:hypothetical protein